MNRKKEVKSRRNTVLLILILSILISFMGALFNTIAVQNNNCKMPVYTENIIHADSHFSFTDISQVKAFYLTDIFHIGYYFFSIGDFLMYSAILSMILLLTYIVIKRKDFVWK